MVIGFAVTLRLEEGQLTQHDVLVPLSTPLGVTMGARIWRFWSDRLRRHQKRARRLGPMGLAVRSFLHKTNMANVSARPFGPRHLHLSSIFHKNTTQCKCPSPHFFARSMSASRSRTCCARLGPRRVLWCL